MANVDLTQVFQDLDDLAVAIIPVFSTFGALAGVYLIGSAAKELVAPPQGREGPNFTGIGVRLLIAAILIQFTVSVGWTATDLMAGAGGGTRASVALIVPTTTTGTTSVWSVILSACFRWLAVMGMAGIFRGFLKWNEAGSGDNRGGSGDPFWSGCWHIVGGAILFNIGTS